MNVILVHLNWHLSNSFVVGIHVPTPCHSLVPERMWHHKIEVLRKEIAEEAVGRLVGGLDLGFV